MIKTKLLVVVAAIACTTPTPETAPPPVAPSVPAIVGVVDTKGEIPPMPREARGVWIASVGNMDWPSKAGLPVESQKAELRAILDKVKQLRMNLVILQVRPAGDALYASSLEPWSQYLTGTMGKAPEPFYDPLAFAIEEAHLRGLELHAWFNPYRARYGAAKVPMHERHIARRRPDLVVTYGRELWMDPGESEVQNHSLNVILDVVKRYDVDGIHIDDYFYPYRVDDPVTKRYIQFPDSLSWNKYVANGGHLSRADWRRNNVDQFVERLHHAIKKAKPQVKFGISPFGIWRPGHPASVRGLDSYVEIFADSKKWLNNGWLDYFVPQLYWRIESPQQSYAQLMQWWTEQNRHDRQIWIGNAAFRVRADQQNWPPDEIANQIALTRANKGVTGNIHFNMSSLMKNRGGVSDAIAAHSYRFDALMPPMQWLDDDAPAPPHIRLVGDVLELRHEEGEAPLVYAVRMKYKDGWHAETIPAVQVRYALRRATNEMPQVVGVTAVDRHGNESDAIKIVLTSSTRF